MRHWMASFIALWAAAAYAQDIQDKVPPGDVNDRILEESVSSARRSRS